MVIDFFLAGQRGVYVTSAGLTIAYLSGKHQYDAYKSNSDGQSLVSDHTILKFI
jgi:hypothetical protein